MPQKIGFPAGVLGENPLRLDVLAANAPHFA